MLDNLKKEIKKDSNIEKAKIYQRFFKTGKGEYGEGDIFLGLSVPEQRKIAKQYQDLELKEIRGLLQSKIHEERLIALLILVEKYGREPINRKKIFDFYLESMEYVNNWDLVDLSADKIVGRFLFDGKEESKILTNLAKSSNLWEKRIAMISSFYFIKQGKFDESLKIAEILLNDSHDLIHKAVGWMLREIGNRDLNTEERFLKKHYKNMPRTMLRYAIEKFPEEKRQDYLKGRI